MLLAEPAGKALPRVGRGFVRSRNWGGKAMAERGRRVWGLRLTLRQQMIAVVYFAVVFAIMGTLRDTSGELDLHNGILLAILLTPWMLGFVVMLLDRPGPLRNWSVSTILMLFPPALALGHDWTIAPALLDTG